MNVPKVGQKIDNYELISVLGEGGLGIVYKARQSDVDRLVAIKILHPHIVNEEFRSRFFREAQILSKLTHVNIVNVYHMGVSGEGLTFIVMEFADGPSLRKILIDEDKFETIRSLKVISQAAKALGYVHKHGIIHRDLKLENILLMRTPEPDTVKIIDFGLAGLSEEQNQRLTKTGAVVGTVSYMSPEQCTGQKVDSRSDIYSLAVCMYELITGSRPFEADTPVGVMYQHISNETPSLQKADLNNYIAELDELIARAMKKQPTDRFQTMEEFAEAIDRVIDVLEGRAVSKPLRKGNRNANFALFSVVVLIVLLMAVSFFSKSRQNKKVETSEKATRYTESLIVEMIAAGKHRRAVEMCDSTLKSNLLTHQRMRILMLRGQKTGAPAGIYYYKKAVDLCSDQDNPHKLGSYMGIARQLRLTGLEATALQYLHKIVDASKTAKISRRIDLQFNNRDLTEAFLDISEINSELGKPDQTSLEVVSYLEKNEPDINDCWSSVMGNIASKDDATLAQRLIKVCPFTIHLAFMSLECTKFSKFELAEECLRKARKIGYGDDSHQDYRHGCIILAETRLLLEKGDYKKARQILEQESVFKEIDIAERQVLIDRLWQNMLESGIPAARIQEILKYNGVVSSQRAEKLHLKPDQKSICKKIDHGLDLMHAHLYSCALREFDAALGSMTQKNWNTSKIWEEKEFYAQCQLCRAIILQRFGKQGAAGKILSSLRSDSAYANCKDAFLLALALRNLAFAERIARSGMDVNSYLSCADEFCKHGLYDQACKAHEKADLLADSLASSEKPRNHFKVDINAVKIFLEMDSPATAKRLLPPLIALAMHDSSSTSLHDLYELLGYATLAGCSEQELDALAQHVQARERQELK